MLTVPATQAYAFELCGVRSAYAHISVVDCICMKAIEIQLE